jgi:carbon monoxide dehydrogenase subunit G
MAEGKAEITIDRTPDEVWAVVGRFDGLEEWMPGIDSCEMDGDVRKLASNGMELQEKLMGRDEDAKTISYSLIKGPVPIEHHLATVSVEPDGEGSKLTWAYEVKPDEMLAAFAPIYDGSVQTVKQQLEK